MRAGRELPSQAEFHQRGCRSAGRSWPLGGERLHRSGFSSSLAIGEALAASITGTPLPAGLAPLTGLAPLAPGSFGPLTDAELVTRGVWQYARYYGPA